ncbi:MAG: GMP/IMP nucleotidase [Pseudomonadales bacterium]|nr:GMP/IMP nucleotidase [Pseudomonadales bacterium]
MLNWDNIETVLLDMDGTLLDLHYDNYFWQEHLPSQYAKQNSIPLDQAKTHLQTLFSKQSGTLNWYCVDFWSDCLQVDIPALKKEIDHLIGLRPQVAPFLKWLSESSRSCYLVTNAHEKSLSLKLNKTGIDQYLDGVFCSHEFGAPKESQEFWLRFQKKLPFEKTNTLLIDDNESVLVSAKTFGIRHLLSIEQPDSHLSPRELGEFPAVTCYSKLAPLD